MNVVPRDLMTEIPVSSADFRNAMRHLTGGAPGADTLDQTGGAVVDPGGFGESGRKRVDATVIDPPEEQGTRSS